MRHSPILLPLALAACSTAPMPSPSLAERLQEHGFDTTSLVVQIEDPTGDVYRFDVAAGDAIATWMRLRPLTDELGHYPVVCSDESGTLLELPELNEDSPAQIAASAESIDAADWLAAREAGDPDYYGEVEFGEWDPDLGPNPANWTIPFDLDGEPLAEVWIAFVPTTSPWEALAHLRYGHWNECPPSAAHVAVHRSWYERFGAEVVAVSGDTVEMRVTRPAGGEEACRALAREQFLYSGGDLVFQGAETLGTLASLLNGSGYWFFWWD